MVSAELHNESLEQSEGITLERNKTFYGWKIKVKGFDLEKIEEINDKLLEKYGHNPHQKLNLE